MLFFFALLDRRLLLFLLVLAAVAASLIFIVFERAENGVVNRFAVDEREIAFERALKV